MCINARRSETSVLERPEPTFGDLGKTGSPWTDCTTTFEHGDRDAPSRSRNGAHKPATLRTMARRRDRRRRAARRASEQRVVEARTEEHFDRDEALAKWKQKLATMTARGFDEPPFASLVP